MAFVGGSFLVVVLLDTAVKIMRSYKGCSEANPALDNEKWASFDSTSSP